MRGKFLLFVVVGALIAGACGGSGDGDEPPVAADPPADESDDDDDDATPAVATTELPNYFEEAAAIEGAATDRDLPPVAPESVTGAYGYSRYVFTQSGDEVVPALVEGPLGRQLRCQELEQECSYPELKALYESEREIPDYLGMDRETLGELVAQLDRVNAAVMQYESIDDVCALGFTKSTNQNANMGIHMIDQLEGPFDPDRPQMVLFAKEGAGQLTGNELGDCVDGRWTGEDGFEPVGAVFNIRLTEDHPEGFAGPIDNWHVHYNTCISRRTSSEDDATGRRISTSAADCQAAGGTFLPIIPSWMMHAYVADDFEAEAGVFSMFNPSIWPVSDNDELLASRTMHAHDAALDAPINNFDFGRIVATVGVPIRFNNSDSVPHTVTAGTPLEPLDDFDSGVLATGQTYDLTFDEPGEYQLYCVLHPEMQATVVVTA